MFKKLGLVVLILGLGVGAGFWLGRGKGSEGEVAGESQNKYVAFFDEVFSIIQENYWQKVSDEQLADIFVAGTEKLTGQPLVIKDKSKEGLLKVLEETMEKYGEDEVKKKDFTTMLSDLVLSNLEPFGRSRLYTQKDEKALADNVNNVSGEDRYEQLGVEKDAKPEEIEVAFEEKLEEAKTEEEKAELEEAYKVLADEANKALYDERGVDPTMDWKLFDDKVFWIHLKKFSPTTFDEMKRVAAKVPESSKADTLVFDLRDNVGGAIDGLPYFLGPFIGQGQYGHQYFHQGETEDFKTKTGWLPELVRYKKVVILINENAQSTAEAMAAVLKRYNVGVLVGRTSKGWGTVERVFPIKTQIADDEHHSLFLVHRLTLRDDNQPIEGRGVEPMILVDSPTWKEELYQYFSDQKVVEIVEQIWNLN